MARDRLLPLHQPQLHELRTAVRVRGAIERELVGRRSVLARDELVERAGMTDLVLSDRRERHVLFQERSDPRPLRITPAEDELVVSDLEQRARVLLVHGPP